MEYIQSKQRTYSQQVSPEPINQQQLHPIADPNSPQHHYYQQPLTFANRNPSTPPVNLHNQQQLLRQISKMTHRIIQIEEEMYHYQNQNGQIKQECRIQVQIIADLERQIRQLRTKLATEYQQTNYHKTISVEKEHQIQSIQSIIRQLKLQIQNLQFRNDNIVSINRLLRQQMKQADGKITQLETKLQQNMCTNYEQSILRLKTQTSDQQNYQSKCLKSKLQSSGITNDRIQRVNLPIKGQISSFYRRK